MTRIYKILSKNPLTKTHSVEFYSTKSDQGEYLLAWSAGHFLLQHGEDWFFISDSPLEQVHPDMRGVLYSTSRAEVERLLAPFGAIIPHKPQLWEHVFVLDEPLENESFWLYLRDTFTESFETIGFSYNITEPGFVLHAPFPVINLAIGDSPITAPPILLTRTKRIDRRLKRFKWRRVENPALIDFSRYSVEAILNAIPQWSIYDITRNIHLLPYLRQPASPPNSIVLRGLELEFLIYREDEFVPAYEVIDPPSYSIGVDGNSEVGELRTHPTSRLEDQIYQISELINQLSIQYLRDHYTAIFTTAREPGACGLHIHIGTERPLSPGRIDKLESLAWDLLSPVYEVLIRDPAFAYRCELGYGIEDDIIGLSDHPGFELRFFPATFGTRDGIKLTSRFAQQLTLSIIKDSPPKPEMRETIRSLTEMAERVGEFII